MRVLSVGGNAIAQNYTATKHPVNVFKAAVALAAESAYRGPVLDCPLSMRIVFVFPRPSSKVWKKRPMPREPYATKKNDWDNCGKSVCDALNRRLFADDGLLVSVTVERWIASGDEQPHCHITITELTGQAGEGER
jgi:Holliday junction resolvase RusA-like endonuclease